MIISPYANSQVIVNNDYYVPYIAGSSKDGKTVYIDKRLPRYVKTKSGRVRDNFPFVVKHEVVEWYAEIILKKKYAWAHEHYATVAERELVQHEGFDWDEYQNFFHEMVKKLKEIPGPIPPDLLLKPELDSGDMAGYHKYKQMEAEEQ